MGDSKISPYSQMNWGKIEGFDPDVHKVKRAAQQGVENNTKPKSPAEMEKAATDFEALLLQDMFKSMWETVPKDGMLSGSREEASYRDMLNEALANNIAKGKSIGIKDVILKEFKKREGQ